MNNLQNLDLARCKSASPLPARSAYPHAGGARIRKRHARLQARFFTRICTRDDTRAHKGRRL